MAMQGIFGKAGRLWHSIAEGDSQQNDRRARDQAAHKLSFIDLEERLVPATFNVSTLTALRTAIAASNASTDASDTINIAAGTYDVTSDGMGELVVNQFPNTHTLNIVGAGKGLTILTGNDQSRILTAGITDGPLNFRDLTMTAGRATDGQGGAVNAPGFIDVSLDNVQITDSVSTGTGAAGGAISLGSGTLNVIRSDFNNNRVEGGLGNGGAINSTFGDVTVNDSRIIGNSATGDGSDGGGLSSIQGDVVILNSVITNNDAEDDGGGIHSFTGLLSIDNSTISTNTAQGSGGGIYKPFDVLDLQDSTLANNEAMDDGGAIYNSGDGVSIVNSTLSNNTTLADGGALFNFVGSTIESIASSTIVGNMASGDGGGIYNQNLATISSITNTIVAQNVALGEGNDIDNDGRIASERFNLVGDGVESDFDIGPANARGSLVGTTSAPVDPLLNGLAANGGITRTHLPRPGSPVIDAGDPGFVPPPNFDQRNVPFDRVDGGRIDIGAVETQTADDTGPTSPGSGQGGINTGGDFDVATGRLDLNGTEGNDLVTLSQESGAAVRVTVNGVDRGLFVGVTNVTVFTQGGDDTVRLLNAVTLPVVVDGGAGTDTLDFSAVADSVNVELGSGIDAAGQFANIEDIVLTGRDDSVRVRDATDLAGRIDGGNGIDLLSVRDLRVPVNAVLAEGGGVGVVNGTFAFERFERFEGSAFGVNTVRQPGNPALSDPVQFRGGRVVALDDIDENLI